MNPKYIYNFIKQESGDNSLRDILLMALISGFANAFMLAFINSSTSKVSFGDFNYTLIFVYVIIFVIYVISLYRSIILTSFLAEDITFNIRQRIITYMVDNELEEFEVLGQADIYTRLTNDTNEIANSSQTLVMAVQSTLLVFFGIVYLCFLNTTACLFTVLVLFISSFNYIVSSKKLKEEISALYALETVFFEKINELTGGFKELKVNQEKKFDLLYGKIQKISQNVNSFRKKLSDKLGFFFVFAQTFFYILLGVIVYVLPVYDNDILTNVTKITATIFFIIMPLSVVLQAAGSYSKTSVAITNLTNLEQRLKTNISEYDSDQKIGGIFNNFERIHFNNLKFSYKDKSGKEKFSIGPINFEVRRGEVIFIIGGNGSGKSTLFKMLTGLYQPMNGNIIIDGVAIDKKNIREYRDLFGAIFSDFFLFSELYGIENIDEANVTRLIRQMQLEKKTSFKERAFTNQNLSTGQRKRLAMISVILENKNLLVFDEWAADQDPEFRKYFYDELIFEFIKQGKTIIAITHDDHYFNKADRIYKMDYGKFTEYNIVG